MKQVAAESTSDQFTCSVGRSERNAAVTGPGSRGVLSPPVSIRASPIKRYDQKEKTLAATGHAVVLEQLSDIAELSIIALAKEGRYEELVASIARLSDLKYRAIDRIMSGRRLRELAFVCKSLGFKQGTLNEIFRLAKSLNRATEAELSDAGREFFAVSSEIASSVLAAMTSFNPRPSHDIYYVNARISSETIDLVRCPRRNLERVAPYHRASHRVAR